MNMFKLNTAKRMTKSLLLFGFGFMSVQLSAGPLNISNNALEIATGVEPNVMILSDDSGSMDWTILAADDQGTYVIQNTLVDTINIFGAGAGAAFNVNASYLYTFNDGDNADTNNVAATPFPTSIAGGLPNFFTLPTENALNNFNTNVLDLDAAGYSNWRGVWRVRNSSYNSTYYNPNVAYQPWKGGDDAGNAYVNSNPTAALVDPFLSGGSTVDLTANSTLNSYLYINSVTNFVDPSSFFFILPDNQYPASYYTWTDTDGDNTVDEEDAHELIQIRTSGACTNGASCPTNFTRQGTRTDCGGDGLTTSSISCNSTQELQNFANWYSYYRRRELTAKAAIAATLEEESSIRVGMATINNFSNTRIQVESLNISAFSGNKQTLYDRVFQTQSSGGTPLREGLEETGNYFSCVSDNIFDTGASTPGNTNCPVEASPAGECQQNYTILMTDGFWNGDDPSVDNADGDGTGGAADGPFDGASFADNFSDTLADVAMHYYERDLHGSLQDDVPTTTRDRSRYNGSTDPFETMHQHMTTYTIGFGVNGTLSANPANAADAFTWPDASAGNAEKIDDLRHAAWNGRGDFLSATNQEELTSSLEDIFREIQSGTGAASAVAFNTQDLRSGSRVFRAFFNINDNTGNLVSQNISNDGIIDTSSSTWGDGGPEDGAAQLLDTRAGADSDNRAIVTYDKTNFVGIPFQYASLNATQQAQIKLPTITDNPPTPDELGEDRINYLRGQTENQGSNLNAGEFRVRKSVASKLGDIIHSAPVFVGSPPFGGRDAAPYPISLGDLYSEFRSANSLRSETVYIGANDGMMHGFNATDGTELFAFVPNTLFPALSELTDPDYEHRYFVDMTAAINDVFITPTSGTNSGVASWNTVMVGGMGVGAPGYFGLNITDPAALNSEATAATNVMWEFSQSDDIGGPAGDNLNLGVSIREPIIAMSNVDGVGGEKRWVAIFGNGYNSASTDGDAELYVLFLDGGLDGTWTQGSDYIKISTGNGKAESADGTTPNGLGSVRGIDVSGDGTVDVVYAGDLQGNLYRFNLNSTTVSGLTNPVNNPVQELFQAHYNSATGPIQPITNRPIVVKNPNETGFIVLIGTGSYFTVEDTTSTDIQSIYGIWDDFTDPSDPIVPVVYDRLQEQVFTNSAPVNGFVTRTLTNETFTFGTNGQMKQGWVIDLDVTSAGSVEFPGERAIRNFLLRGDFVFVNSVIPKSGSACTTGPGGFELGFNPVTGGSGTDPVFDLNDDGIFDSDDNVGGVDDEANIVSGTRFDKATPSDSATIGNRKVTQTSDKDIRSIGINAGDSSDTGRHSWREILVDQ